MEKLPLVTIITPTYNREDFLPEAIESVLAQTYANFEHIIVDDGSTDNSARILDEYADKDERITILRQENQGQSVARNKGLEKAKGEFVCFLDSDNYWPEKKLEDQINLFRKNEKADVIYGDIVTVNENGNELSRNNMRRHSGKIVRWLLRDNCVSMNTAMARRTCFDEMGGMSAKRRVADDYDLWLRFSANYTFLYVPEFWVFYRVMKDQISSDKTARFESNESIIKDFRDKFPDALGKKEFDSGFSVFYVRKARYLASVGKKKDSYKEIFKALRYQPLGVGVWRAALAITLR